mmetsp:Transcript_61302/g.189856  ORF Transcript_61302/g.189856 Transcript_61302/m.189856 type:complete len:746 (+) Transcript_61302:36-2273(+)
MSAPRRLLLGALLVLPRGASGNVIVRNQGYCDLELLAREGGKARPLGVVHGLGVKKVPGHVGARLELRRRGEPRAAANLTVPGFEPLPGRELTLDFFKWAHGGRQFGFHDIVVRPTLAGADCARPEPRAAADSATATAVILATAATVLGSFLAGRGDGRMPRGEFLSFLAITAVYFGRGFLVVHRTSRRYMAYALEEGVATDEVNGDKVWGLFADYPLLSAVLGGRRWDRKDLQLRGLVENAWLIPLLILGHLGIKAVLSRRGLLSRSKATLLCAVPFIGFLHETTSLIPLGFAALNFALVRACGSRPRTRCLVPVVAWALGAAAICASGGEVVSLAALGSLAGPRGQQWGRTLDGFKGEVRWAAALPLLVLRTISWAIDFHRSLAAAEAAAPRHEGTDHGGKGAAGDERLRAECHRPAAEYQSMVLYLSYLFYPPLYVTGPIITFNAFASFMDVPQCEVVGRGLVRFWARCFMNLSVFVVVGHFLYTFALAINGPSVTTSGSRSIIFDYVFYFGQDGEGIVWFSFWSLKGIWLKFLVIWRIARAWALTDGVNPPENMNRCMSNNFSVRGFWRQWHRSFNRWLVRYIFAPLGGSRRSLWRQLASTGVVFSFVAVWHEPSVLHGDSEKLNLLAWGWSLVAFLLPEMAIDRLLLRPGVRGYLEARPLLARHLTALGGSVCIQLLFVANLIGYSYGLQGARQLLSTCGQRGMVVFLLGHEAWLYACTQVMLFIRQREAEASVVDKKNF